MSAMNWAARVKRGEASVVEVTVHRDVRLVPKSCPLGRELCTANKDKATAPTCMKYEGTDREFSAGLGWSPARFPKSIYCNHGPLGDSDG